MVYASHATSFNPKGGFYTDASRAPLPNESGKGDEIGIRTTIFDDKVDVGLAYYTIEKFNIRINNPLYDEDAINPSTGLPNVPDVGVDYNGQTFNDDEVALFATPTATWFRRLSRAVLILLRVTNSSPMVG